ncbi:hypothetical protein ACODGR_04805 [Vagococcus fluvialis]|uniref:hypothetical protein n=1 Tax=Vagococcus fluvialis TaxID=2738 RepID=UPI003B2232A7
MEVRKSEEVLDDILSAAVSRIKKIILRLILKLNYQGFSSCSSRCHFNGAS